VDDERRRVPGWVSEALVPLAIGGCIAFQTIKENKAKAQAKIVAEQQQKAKEEQDRAEAQKRAAADAQRKAKEEQDKRITAERQRAEEEQRALRAQGTEFRTWTDTSGRQATAVYVGSSDEYVEFRDQDGNVNRLRKSSLSRADQDLVRRLEQVPEVKAAKERNQAQVRKQEELEAEQAREREEWAATGSPPQKDPACRYIVGITNAKVESLLRRGSLLGAQFSAVHFEPVDEAGYDARIHVFYDFTFETQAGPIRRNQGYYLWLHVKGTRTWTNTYHTIDGMPLF
jgi:hypothetical protein